MKSNWRVYTKKADFKAIGERFGIDQVMARIIRNRGLETDEQINMYLVCEDINAFTNFIH